MTVKTREKKICTQAQRRFTFKETQEFPENSVVDRRIKKIIASSSKIALAPSANEAR
jgi:hypothetical protein